MMQEMYEVMEEANREVIEVEGKGLCLFVARDAVSARRWLDAEDQAQAPRERGRTRPVVPDTSSDYGSIDLSMWR